jgi:transposase
MSKRRKFTSEFKAQVVLALLSGIKSSAELCREHHLAPQVLGQWKSLFLERASSVFGREEASTQDAVRIAELERLVGRLTLEAEILKKATSLVPVPSTTNGR